MTGLFSDAAADIGRRDASIVDLPLTPLQARWWTLVTQHPGGSSPIVSLVHRLRGPLDREAWSAAVDSVVERHEILRTRFVRRDGRPAQVVEPGARIVVEQVDLTHLPEADRPERARLLLNERREVTFDLLAGPLAASCLVRLADDDHVWSLIIHHILADGASLDVIDRELSVLYPAHLAGTGVELPALTVQYGDYAVWQASHADSDEDAELDYWRAQLAGVSNLDFRTALPRPDHKGAAAAEHRRVLDADLLRAVEALATRSRCTRFMVLLAALFALLHRATGQDDLCVGVPIRGAARTRPELAGLVGLFNNSLAIRVDASGDPTFAELLVRTRDVVMDALDNQNVAFGQVVAALAPPVVPGRAQIFQVMFGMDEADAVDVLTLPGLRVEEFPLAIPKILHDLMVFAWPVSDGLLVRFVHDTGILERSTVELMTAEFEELLWAATNPPAGPSA